MYRQYPILLLLLAVLMALGMAGIYQRELVQIEQNLRLESDLLMQRQIETLNAGVEVSHSDVRYLAGQIQLKGLYQSDNINHAIATLEQEYLLFSSTKTRYDQVRFIENQGMEVARVNFNAGSPAIVPRSQLQNKAHRYYFAETTKLDAGDVYTSPLDLNIENKEVELPLKPMIRFATPVFGNTGERIGVVVLNYLAQQMLSAFNSNSQSFPGHAVLMNQEGYFLIGPDKELEWAFMFEGGERARLELYYPVLWEALQQQEAGQFLNDRGLFTFTSMENEKLSQQCQACNWSVILHVPQEKISDAAFRRIEEMMPTAAALYLTLALILWVVFVYRQRQHENSERLDQLHHAITSERDLFVGGPTVVFKRRNEYSWPVEWVSENIRTVLGYDPEQFMDGELAYTGIVAPEFLKQVADDIQQLKSGRSESPEQAPYQLVHADGRKIWVQESASVVRDDSGRVTHIYGYINDISDRIEAEKQIQRSHAFNQTVIDTIADPTLVIDALNYTLIHANKAACNLYLKSGQKLEEIETCYQLSHKRNNPCSGEHEPCPVNQVIKNGSRATVIHKHFTADDTAIYVEVTATPIFNDKGEVIQIIESHHDITERMKTEAQLREMATTDGLTRVSNRTKFEEELQTRFDLCRRTKQSLALIMLDIDHFKLINDNFGHDVGDLVLKEMVQVIRHKIRKSDLLARWGGEEFMLLATDIGLSNLEKMAENLRSSLEEHNFTTVGQVTASFGVSLMSEQDTIESLIKRADEALYASKQHGRNRVTLSQG